MRDDHRAHLFVCVVHGQISELFPTSPRSFPFGESDDAFVDRPHAQIRGFYHEQVLQYRYVRPRVEHRDQQVVNNLKVPETRAHVERGERQHFAEYADHQPRARIPHERPEVMVTDRGYEDVELAKDRVQGDLFELRVEHHEWRQREPGVQPYHADHRVYVPNFGHFLRHEIRHAIVTVKEH